MFNTNNQGFIKTSSLGAKPLMPFASSVILQKTLNRFKFLCLQRETVIIFAGAYEDMGGLSEHFPEVVSILYV